MLASSRLSRCDHPLGFRGVPRGQIKMMLLHRRVARASREAELLLSLAAQLVCMSFRHSLAAEHHPAENQSAPISAPACLSMPVFCFLPIAERRASKP
jgi:hypothetical protein